VENWLNNADDEQLFLSVISLGEIFKGLTILPESKRRQQLQLMGRGDAATVV
jgi:hypothetical protein